MVLYWHNRLKFFAVVFFMTLTGIFAAAETGDATGEAPEENIGEEVVFRPPDAGAPADRVGAGTRDLSQQGGGLVLLVPAGGGITTRARPVLIWYLTEDFDGAMHAQIAAAADLRSGVARLSEGPLRAGYYALDLARSEMSLVPGEIYEWKVLLLDKAGGAVVDEKQSYVERRAESLGERGNDTVSLAAAGLWFDALGTLVEIGLSGRVRITEPRGFAELVSSAGLRGLPAAP